MRRGSNLNLGAVSFAVSLARKAAVPQKVRKFNCTLTFERFWRLHIFEVRSCWDCGGDMFQRVQAAKRAADHLNQDQLQQQQQQQQYDDAPNTPLVFQCANCRTIVGDSLSLGDADEAAQTISLSCKSVILLACHERRKSEVLAICRLPHVSRLHGSRCVWHVLLVGEQRRRMCGS